tara:strand:+ start:207 stop:1457 length:1251 start_codon:yes stop_codon:yes gene_type:complete
MEENKKEEVAQEAKTQENPKVENETGKLKIKAKPKTKKFSQDVSEITKIDLTKDPKEEGINKENETKKQAEEDKVDEARVVEVDNTEADRPSQEQKEVQSENETQETPIVEEVTAEEKEEVEEIKEEVKEAVKEAETTGKEIPENIQKLMEFMEQTGGQIEDYVKLNKDYSKMDNQTLLKEYYSQTKPHLDSEEINFMMEDYFSYDEEIDEEKEIKRKKLALKEQVAQAKQHLESVKSKYYEKVNYSPKLTKEQQKAIDFFNRYDKESKEQQEVVEKQHKTFLNKTNNVFNDNFKGFEYNVGDKRFRYNVKNADDVKNTQSDINNFVKKFLNKNNEMEDAKGYHKSMFTAMNADAIANHFYEQGKADALKQSVAKSKNINMDPRQQHSGEVNVGGIKVKVLGDNSNDFKFKIKNNK